jgi:ketosteroid isomerase-like protein
MTGQHERLVRDAFEALARGDLSTLLKMVDTDFEWTFLDPSEADPQPQVCHGADELARMVRHGAGQPLRQLIELTPYDERVLVVTQLAIGHESTLGQSFHVVTVNDGRITALRACRSRDEAREVATAR